MSWLATLLEDISTQESKGFMKNPHVVIRTAG